MSHSQQYFTEVAVEWDEIRSGFFTAAMRDAAITRANLPAGAVVADVGTGTGFVLQGLVDYAAELTGFDENAEMLAVARRNFTACEHVKFQQAQGQQLPAEGSSFDAVFANMYLHHAPDPEAAIAEMVRILKPGGKLVITDLDTHDQVWMHEAMADRWLGFDRDNIRKWYAAAGLEEIDIDCAEGTCDCLRPEKDEVSLNVFVAIGRKGANGY
jgi:ubiquinone/menaquinone biosynthesis C-methylase UbiE